MELPPVRYIFAVLFVIAVIMMILDLTGTYKFYDQAKSLGYGDEIGGYKVENRDLFKTMSALRMTFWAFLIMYFLYLLRFNLKYSSLVNKYDLKDEVKGMRILAKNKKIEAKNRKEILKRLNKAAKKPYDEGVIRRADALGGTPVRPFADFEDLS